jgi:hypothetical protein
MPLQSIDAIFGDENELAVQKNQPTCKNCKRSAKNVAVVSSHGVAMRFSYPMTGTISRGEPPIIAQTSNPVVMAQHPWKFFRTGGLDQVSLETGADLLNLENLDQKLWVALSCPVKGLELDEKTLALIDDDGDGRIRVPELLRAIKWASLRLKDTGDLLKGSDTLPLDSINDQTPEGKILLASARQTLSSLRKPTATAISTADSSDTKRILASNPINGDGVIPAEAASDDETKALINDIVACLGGTADQTGSPGVTAEKVDTFFKELSAYLSWVEKGVSPEVAILGDKTAPAFEAIKAVRAKVDDYFARCRLAAFDARSIAALNRSESDYLEIAAKDMKITADEVACFPLATIAPDKPLPLTERVNPAWAARLTALQEDAIAPIFGATKISLNEADWLQLCARFAPYEKSTADKPVTACEKLGHERLVAIAAGKGRTALDELIAKDKAIAPEFQAISDVDRLVRYHRDLRALLHNFVNFADFYSRDKWAVFQAGTLYLDNRSTELCLRVDGASPLAAMSKTYIAYCACTRAGSSPMNLAACFTQGDSDYLFVGRHGVFYDRQGRDWDAVITSIVDNPISIRQAFWSPYKKFIRMIEEQIAKRAAAADAAAHSKLSAAAEHTANVDKAKPIEPPKKFDLALITGIGVAVGSIATFLGVILTKFMDLPAWKMPLLVAAIMLAISTPSMIIAWLKLRQRTLGPILEGNGWAVNGRVKINIPFGSALTDLAKLPPGAKRSLDDPYEDKEAKKRRRQSILLIILVTLLSATIWIRVDAGSETSGNGSSPGHTRSSASSGLQAPIGCSASGKYPRAKPWGPACKSYRCRESWLQNPHDPAPPCRKARCPSRQFSINGFFCRLLVVFCFLAERCQLLGGRPGIASTGRRARRQFPIFLRWSRWSH